jgi:hypothetical protein
MANDNKIQPKDDAVIWGASVPTKPLPPAENDAVIWGASQPSRPSAFARFIAAILRLFGR